MRLHTGNKIIHNKEIINISDFDRSVFYVGDIIYEVVSFENNVFLYIDEHLKRIENSLDLANLPHIIKGGEIKYYLNELLVDNKIYSGSVTIALVYGPTNHFIAYINEPIYPTDLDYEKGVCTKLQFLEREAPHVKSFRKDFKSKAVEFINENNLYESILVDKEGFITEGSRSNVFFVKNNTVITTPADSVLPGVTRKLVIGYCKNLGIELKQQKVLYRDLAIMDACFLTGTTTKVLPVKCIDSVLYNPENEITRKLMIAHKTEREKEIRRFDKG